MPPRRPWRTRLPEPGDSGCRQLVVKEPGINPGSHVLPTSFTCKTALFLGGLAWTRTRDLFLIRVAWRFSGDFQSLQNACKWQHSDEDTFLGISGDLLGLLHGCCKLREKDHL